jgi:hypothetical protein
MGNSSTKRRLIGGAVTLLVLGVVGFVYAAWTADGNGNGYAQAGTSEAVSTQAATVTTAELYPGASNKKLYVDITNGNDFPVTVTAISRRSGDPITSDDAGCNVSSVSFADQTGQSISVGANSNTATTVNGVSMNNTAVDACQGATFTIPVDLAAHSG